MVRIKMVRVPKNRSLMSCLHSCFFSAVLSGVRKCFGMGKMLNILGSIRNYSLGHIVANGLFHSNIADKKYLGCLLLKGHTSCFRDVKNQSLPVLFRIIERSEDTNLMFIVIAAVLACNCPI